jgi:hypothetical protein
MDKKDILHCEQMLDLFNNMYFKELKGKDLVDKMIIFKNFATVISKYKNTGLEVVDKKDPVRPIYESKGKEKTKKKENKQKSSKKEKQGKSKEKEKEALNA